MHMGLRAIHDMCAGLEGVMYHPHVIVGINAQRMIK